MALLGLGSSVGSQPLRRFMLTLKEALSALHFRATGKYLVYLSLARFDQQVTTRYHLDGAPDESFLMLGYEPSLVRSELFVADYTRTAYDLGIEPKKFLADLNPMFADHERLLAPYITPLTEFDPAAAQVLLVNNSSLPFHEAGTNLLGVMHKATILTPLPDQGRVVNSTMIGTANGPAEESVLESARREFLETNRVAGRMAG